MERNPTARMAELRLYRLIEECMEEPVSNIKRILNEIQTDGLLSEPEPDFKRRGNRRIAVDLWVDKLLAFVSSNVPEKRWFGISFLGLTCERCSSKRFETCCALWFEKLLPHVQLLAAAPDFVQAALCTTLSDMFTRLAFGDFPDVKRDGVSFARKLAQPLLEFLSKSNSEYALEGGCRLTCTLLNCFPDSIHRHSDAFEASIVKNLMSEKDNDKLRILAECLAELPKSKGDGTSWFSMMQKLLKSINLHLKYMFQGLEEDSICDKAIRRLGEPGMEHPPPLGGQKISAESAEFASKGLLLSCLKMLNSFYPVPVHVPVLPLLALIERVLMVDGSLAKSTYPFITVMQQEFIFKQLPVLHDHCLDLLAALMKFIGSQLTLHSRKIVRLLQEYSKRCALPRLRMKIYSNLQYMLKFIDSGLAVRISKFVIETASADFKPFVSSMEGRLSNASDRDLKESVLVPCDGKRKRSAATELQRRVGAEAKAPSEASISMMIAALDALEALLLANGVSNNDNLQSQVDDLMIALANAACKRESVNEVMSTNSPNMHSSIWSDFQLASLKALRTSFITCSHVQPTHLAEGRELFRRGGLVAGTKIAEFCTRAEAYPYRKGNTIPGMGFDEPDTYTDDLYHCCLENEYEAEIPAADSNKEEEPLQNSECPPPKTFSSQSGDTRLSTDRAETDIGKVPIERILLQETVWDEGSTFSGFPFTGRMGTCSQLPTDDPSVSQLKHPTSTLHADKGFNSQMFDQFKLEDADDMNSFPDIIDAEPDSD